MRAAGLAAISLLVACGARTSLSTGASVDAASSSDAAAPDAAQLADAQSNDAARPDAVGLDASACELSINTDRPATPGCSHGVTWLAWEITPSQTIRASSISLHTDGEAALLARDAASMGPGALLGLATLGASDANGWSTGPLPSLVLNAGTTYFVAERASLCSVAAGGVMPQYWGSDRITGPWNGPYVQHPWTVRIDGACP